MTTIKPVSGASQASSASIPLHLSAHTAAQLMTAPPRVILPDASVREAAHVLSNSGFSALPVVAADGTLLGVLSRTDIVRYESERDDCYERDTKAAIHARLGRDLRDNLGDGFHLEFDEGPRVAQIMTPIVLAVAPETPPRTVVEIMIERHVHRVFVVDHGNRLLGVVTTTDVLKRLVS